MKIVKLQLLFVTAILAGAVLASPAQASKFPVDIEDFEFVPSTLTICVGDTVRWTNQDGAGHSATSDTGVWDSGILSTGDQFEFTFTAPGTFAYHCTPHSFMTATIIVESGCTLEADTETFSASIGGAVNLALDAGTANASRKYIVVGGVSGTVPGTLLPGGLVTLPLNRDNVTDLILGKLNTPTFMNFSGQLDGNGQATAKFMKSSAPSSFVGRTLYFAYALKNPFDFASNAVAVEIVP